MLGRAFVFINWWQAAQLGHVGWGFSIDDQAEQFFFGSTDHLWRHPWWDLIAWAKYAHVVPGDNNDWWHSTGSFSEMISMMSSGHHIRYHAAKELQVTVPSADKAMLAATALNDNGWSVLVNNCVHQAFTVLSQYGAELPPPSPPMTNLIPKVWFAKLPGERIDLPYR